MKSETIIKTPVEIKIYNGDCLKVLPKIPDNSIDLVITSPPYNINIDYDSWNDNLEWDEYYDWCKKWLTELYRILKKDGRLCLNYPFASNNLKYDTLQCLICEAYSIAKKIGFKYKGIVILTNKHIKNDTAFGSWLSASSPYILVNTEGVLFFYKEQWKKEKNGISTISSKDFIYLTKGVWTIPPDKEQLTPCPFSIQLPIYCIDLFSFVGDVVLDPFAGSFTTGLACLKRERNFIGIEISKNYYNIGKERLLFETQQGKLFDIKSIYARTD